MRGNNASTGIGHDPSPQVHPTFILPSNRGPDQQSGDHTQELNPSEFKQADDYFSPDIRFKDPIVEENKEEKNETSLDPSKFTHTNSNSREATIATVSKFGKQKMRQVLPHNVYVIDKLPPGDP